MNQELETLLKHICKVLKVDVPTVQGHSRKTNAEIARQIFSYRAFKLGANLAEAGKAIRRQRKSVNRMADEYLTNLLNDSDFRVKAIKTEQKQTA